MAPVTTNLDAYIVHMTPATKTTTLDAWIGKTTLSTTLDALLQTPKTKTTTLDAYLSKRKATTLDAYITDTRGAMRGTMLTADRDAMVLKQSGDTIINVDSVPGRAYSEYWNGTAWITGANISAPNSGLDNLHRAPTGGGYWAEMGDATYPFRYTDGADRRFSVDSTGTVYGNAMTFGGSATLNTNDSITLPENQSYATPARVQGTINTGTSVSTLSATWPGATTAGNMLWFFATIHATGIVLVTTPPTGYTQAFNVATSQTRIVGYYKLNCSASEANPSITWNQSSSKLTVTIEEYSGIATSLALDQTATNTHVASTVAVGPTALTTQTTELWVGGLGWDDITATAGALSGGFSQLSATGGAATADAFVTATGTATYNVTMSTLVTAATGIATFKAALITVPTPAANTGTLYVRDSAGVSRFFSKGDNGVEYGPFGASKFASVAITATSSAVVNVAEVSVVSMTVPANLMVVGTTFRIRAHGRTTTSTAPGSAVFRCRIGTSTLSGNIAHTQTHAQTASVTAEDFSIDMDVTVRTTGASGSVLGAGYGLAKGNTAAFTQGTNPQTTTATVAVDTTVQNLVEFTAITGSLTASLTFYVATIEII